MKHEDGWSTNRNNRTPESINPKPSQLNIFQKQQDRKKLYLNRLGVVAGPSRLLRGRAAGPNCPMSTDTERFRQPKRGNAGNEGSENLRGTFTATNDRRVRRRPPTAIRRALHWRQPRWSWEAEPSRQRERSVTETRGGIGLAWWANSKRAQLKTSRYRTFSLAGFSWGPSPIPFFRLPQQSSVPMKGRPNLMWGINEWMLWTFVNFSQRIRKCKDFSSNTWWLHRSQIWNFMSIYPVWWILFKDAQYF